jgi:glycerophosphoryl diester phosphodiesterase
MAAMAAASPITFAHRGGYGEAPRNTLDAFRRAVKLGARGLESDARLSADGDVVLVHDAVHRVGLRRRKVAATSAEQLTAAGVTRLADLYRELGTGFELSLDVMLPDAAAPIIAVARAARAADKLWLCAPSTDVLADVRAHAPDIRVVHSVRRHSLHESALERHAADLARAGIHAVNFHHSEWSLGRATLYHRFELLAFAWDVNEVRHLRAMLAIGIDALYSDQVERMLATVGEWTGIEPTT